MHLDRLTDAAREALEAAFRRAAELRHAAVEPEHLLAALLAPADGPAVALLRGMGVAFDRLMSGVEESLGRRPTVDHVAPSDQYLSRELTQVLDAAEAELWEPRADWPSGELAWFEVARLGLREPPS